MPEKANEQTRSKRDAILEAAYALFAQQGYEDTTIADIAKAADVAVGTVYLYFHNKHEIYTNVSLDFGEKMSEVFRDPAILSLPLEQVPRAVVERSFRFCAEHIDRMSLFKVSAESQYELEQHKRAAGQIAGAIKTFLDQVVERGQLAPFNTEMYAWLLNLLVDSTMNQCFFIEHGAREELFREQTIELIERLLFGPSLREGGYSSQR